KSSSSRVSLVAGGGAAEPPGVDREAGVAVGARAADGGGHARGSGRAPRGEWAPGAAYAETDPPTIARPRGPTRPESGGTARISDHRVSRDRRRSRAPGSPCGTGSGTNPRHPATPEPHRKSRRIQAIRPQAALGRRVMLIWP